MSKYYGYIQPEQLTTIFEMNCGKCGDDNYLSLGDESAIAFISRATLEGWCLVGSLVYCPSCTREHQDQASP